MDRWLIIDQVVDPPDFEGFISGDEGGGEDMLAEGQRMKESEDNQAEVGQNRQPDLSHF